MHCFCKFGGLAFSSHLARNHHACPHEKMGEIGSTEALDLPFHLLASRLFSAQRSEHETNHVAVNLQISSAVNRHQRRFLKRPMVVLLNIEGNCSCLRAKSAHFSGHLPPALRKKASSRKVDKCHFSDFLALLCHKTWRDWLSKGYQQIGLFHIMA